MQTICSRRRRGNYRVSYVGNKRDGGTVRIISRISLPLSPGRCSRLKATSRRRACTAGRSSVPHTHAWSSLSGRRLVDVFPALSHCLAPRSRRRCKQTPLHRRWLPWLRNNRPPPRPTLRSRRRSLYFTTASGFTLGLSKLRDSKSCFLRSGERSGLSTA